MSSKTKTTATKAVGKPAFIPKLRFPEFREAGEWERKTLATYLTDCSGRVPSDTKLPIYSSTRDGLKRQDKYFDGRTLHNNNEYGVVPPNGFVYRHMSDDGLFKFNINETGGEIAVSKEYPVFRTKNLNSYFLLAKLNEGFDFKQFAFSQKAGGTRTRLYFSRLCEWETLIPSPPEQKKIAECLSSLQQLTAGQARKLEALKAHKKGLMQLLFPREGESQPRLRFPEFQNASEWKREKLSSCLIKVIDYRGKAPPKSKSGVPLITAKNVRFGWLDMTNDEYIEEKKYEEWMTRGIPLAGDVLFTTEAPLGNVALFPCAGKFALGQRLLTLRSNPEKCLPEFLFHSLLSPSMQEDIDFHSTGSTAKGIKSKVFVNLSFCYPKDIHEQKFIADCLTKLDDLIAAQTQKLEALKTHKKGLMQQFFPVPAEMEA
ncbi:restriction endonuclease subunit S [Pseudomonas deceptionensis]|uniref:Type I restriction enzyme, S subunit n=1 Tax=Pseudomonas deceptionensis TaxID=882211 RepID=A0A1H5K5K3_PSEDM|nr:restriction endonuclease subunit S [Pseudomonas deceptionensis]SEE59318.1 type I restriction enzyme, S subunit [Pseudomonas deceptionensis]